MLRCTFVTRNMFFTVFLLVLDDNSQDFPVPCLTQPSQHQSQAISRVRIILIDFTNVTEDQQNLALTCHDWAVSTAQCECDAAVIRGNIPALHFYKKLPG